MHYQQIITKIKLFSIVLVFYNNYTFANNHIILKDIYNNNINFSTYKGKWVLINYWASWCEPCVNEISEFNKINRQKDNNIAIFAVNFDQLSTYEQQQLAKKFAIQYPSIQQESLAPMNLGDIAIVPTTFVFDPNGKLATKIFGGQTINSINKIITDQAQLLKQSA